MWKGMFRQLGLNEWKQPIQLDKTCPAKLIFASSQSIHKFLLVKSQKIVILWEINQKSSALRKHAFKVHNAIKHIHVESI